MNRNLNPDEFGYPEPTGLSDDRVPSLLQRWDTDPDTMMDVYESADASEPERRDVPLSALHAYQTDVERPSLDHLTSIPDFSEVPPIELVEHQGSLFVRDGSHRANAAMLRGLSTFPADVKKTRG